MDHLDLGGFNLYVAIRIVCVHSYLNRGET